MKHYQLDDMAKGWFVGAFVPSAHSTTDCEVAVKHYKLGDHEAAHYHKIATEITLVLTGRVRMADREWDTGDIIVLDPGEATDFHALSDASTVVVKIPGCTNDKYLVPLKPSLP